MPKINVLDPHVADLIAAGEVVERPASAAKELIENAIDAGASAVTVEVAGGGVRLLRVTDNGCGMASEDAERAFLRHATSKIRTADDLHTVETLGFRGEALAAVSAVSRIHLITRAAGEALGLSLKLEAGRVAERRETGCPEGTTIVVRDLFFNTPARQKFLKKDMTETAHVQLVCQRAALSHPEISVQCIKDGRQAFITPGDGLLRSCLYSLFGRDFVAGLCETDYEMNGIRVWGFISRPEASQGSRSAQHVLVGGRPVHSRTVGAALDEAYRHSMPAGRYPACVLHIQLPPADCDVNVHPAKSEVKFVRDRDVFDAVYFAAKGTLQALDRPAWSRTEPNTAPREAFHGTARPRPDAFGSMTAEAFRALHKSGPSAPPEREPAPPGPAHSAYASPVSELSGPVTLPVREAVTPYIAAPAVNAEAVPAADPVPPREEAVPMAPAAHWRYIGEALGGYLLVEEEGSLVLIDKHAAHERIIFNRLSASLKSPMAQMLISPLVVTLPPVELAALLSHEELLTGLGFSAEDFGDGTLVVREAPADMDMDDLPALLGEIAARLREGRRDSAPQVRDDVLHLVACKAAIKLGRSSHRQEAEALVRLVMTDPEVRHCPHGRPVAVALSRAAIDRQFKR